jgi:hypothetical protein
MSKILLVFDNYTEMIQIETQLRRVGFDAVGIGSELSLSNQVVELNPSIIIAYGQGSRVNTLSVAKKIKDMVRWQGKVILVFPETLKPQPDDFLKMRMDMAIEAPPKIERIVQVIAKLQNLDEIQLLEKLKNFSEQDGQDHQLFKAQLHQGDSQFIKGQAEGQQPFSKVLHGLRESDADPSLELKKFQLPQEQRVVSKSKTLDEEANETARSKVFQIQEESTIVSSSQEKESQNVFKSKPEKEDDAAQILEFLAKQEEAKKKRKSSRLESLSKPELEQGQEQGQEPQSEAQIERDIVHETNKALEGGQTRVERYKKFLTNMTFNPKSTVQRKFTRRIQQELMQGVSVQETENQDERRRDFTRALFHSRK